MQSKDLRWTLRRLPPASAMIIPAQKDAALLADIEAAPDNGRELHVWWLGQSGFLVKHDGMRVLFDPYLSDSLTTKYAATDKPHVRMTERCISPGQLTGITAITSSHMHTDHFDPETLLPLLAANPRASFIYTTANRKSAAERLGGSLPEHACGLSDGDSIFAGMWEARGVIAAHNEVERDDIGQTRFMGIDLRIGRFRLYHSGDTLWHDDIVRSMREHGGCDIAFVPINGNKPERRVAGNLNGTEAAALAKAVNARVAIPHHFEMFEFNTEPPDEFVSACQRLGQDFRVMRCGERFTLQADESRHDLASELEWEAGSFAGSPGDSIAF